jgi:Tol biopolymer transport system component/DNA-binding winged helix-turn-helix (wHTH) protein
MDAEHSDYQFDTVEVRKRTFEVWKAGAPLSLEPKSIRLLIYLIANRDRTVTKEEIFGAIWTDTVVTDNALTRVIAQLRRELGDDARQPRYIQTVPTFGYRFIAQVTTVPLAAPAVLVIPKAASRRYLIAGIAVFAIAAVAVWMALQTRATAAWPAHVRSSGSVQLTTSSGLDLSPSFSPDGNFLAYSSDRSGRFEICIRPVAGGGREVQLTTDGGQNIQPAWSPDGRSIAFHRAAEGGIWIVPAQGGAARQVAKVGSQPAWSPDSSRVVFRSEDVFSISANDMFSNARSSILVVPAAGGEPVAVTQAGLPDGRHLFPSFSPDGKRILFSVQTGRTAELWTAQLGASAPVRLSSLESNVYLAPTYGPRGDSIFYGAFSKTHDFGIWQLRLKPDGSRPVGEPLEVIRTGTSIPRDLALSRDGKHLAYTSSIPASSLWTLAVPRAAGEAPAEPRPLYKDVVFRTSSPIFSPDGKRIAFFVRVFGGRGDIWVMNADGSGSTPLTSSNSLSMMPSWSPDGSAVLYTRQMEKGAQLWQASVSDRSEKPLMDCQAVMGWSRLSPDGTELVYHTMNRQGVANVWTLPLATGKPRQLTHDTESAGFPGWSPDGRWIVYETFRGGNTYLYLMDRNGGGQTQLNSDRGHSWAFSWSPDSSKILFAGFRQGAWNLWSFDRGTGRQEKLTNYASLATYVRYPSWSPDGKQIVFEYSTTRGNIYLTDLQ